MSRLVLSALLALVATTSVAETVHDVRTLLSHRASIDLGSAGKLARVELPPAVLAECRPDLADLRLLGEDGVPVPFLLDSARAPRAARDGVLVTHPLHLLGVDREEIRSDSGPTEWVELYEVEREPIGQTPPGDWALVLETSAPLFVRHVTVVAVELDGHKRPLVTDAPIYRLTAPARERLRIPLDGQQWRLRVEIRGEGDRYLDPTMRLEVMPTAVEVARAAIPLTPITTEHGDGRTVIALTVPGALVPDRLLLDTTTPAFSRLVSVARTGPRSANAVVVGHDVVARAVPSQPIDPAEVVLRESDGTRLSGGTDRLTVTVHDGDSPPLENLSFTALVPIPTLVFAKPDRPVHLYFGGRRLRRPRYDVARLAELWQSLDASTDVGTGTLGPPATNPGYDPRPLLEMALQPAAAIDRRPFSHRRPLDIPESPDGLVHLQLLPEDIAIARRDLADVRVVDANDRQWPYLTTSDVDPTWQEVGVEHIESKGGWTSYRILLPTTPALTDRLEIGFSAPVVSRDAQVTVPGAREPDVIARGPIGLPTTSFVFEERWTEELTLRVRDGDEQPLALDRARLRAPGRALAIVAPAGTYALLLGNPNATAPEYSLQKIGGLVAEADGVDTTAGPLEPNPLFAQLARVDWKQGGMGPTIVVWAVVALAALALLVVTLRLVRQRPAEEPDAEPEDETKGSSEGSSEPPTL